MPVKVKEIFAALPVYRVYYVHGIVELNHAFLFAFRRRSYVREYSMKNTIDVSTWIDSTLEASAPLPMFDGIRNVRLRFAIDTHFET